MTNTCTHEDQDTKKCTECKNRFCDNCEPTEGMTTCDDCMDILCHNCVIPYAHGFRCNYCDDDTVECTACGGDASKECGSVSDGQYFCDDNCVEGYEEEKAEKEQEKADLESALEELKLNEEQENEVRENFRTGGRASRRLWEAIRMGDDVEGLLEAIGVAHYRHNETDYNSIDKRGMSEEGVADLRKSVNR